MRQLMMIMEESEASKKAKQLGLSYMGFGRYGKKGKQTHKVDNGKLVPVSAKDAKQQKIKGAHTAVARGTLDPELAKQFIKTQTKQPSLPKGVEPYSKGKVDPDNWWRDAFYAHKGKMNAQDVERLMKIHPDLKKSFSELKGDYINKKGSEYVWPEMQFLLQIPNDESESDSEKLENEILDQQEKLIAKKFGAKAADSANYGWVADDNMYGTKVYTNSGTKVLATHIGKGGKLTHQWEDE